MNGALSRFLLVSTALSAAHQLGDQWLQTSHQACNKGGQGWPARRAAAAHVASYTVAGAVAVTIAAHQLRVPLSPGRLALALATNAASHYIADRREPLRRMARLVGRGEYLQACRVVRQAQSNSGEKIQPDETGPGTALFELDQAWHYACIFVSALIAAGRD
jgi:hypothetical protein